jgi:osmotically-inducible protein OsmY
MKGKLRRSGKWAASWLGAALFATAAGAGPTPAAKPRALTPQEQAVSALLVSKLGSDARTIRVAVTRDKVYLTGDVVERVTQELAGEVAASFPGVRAVSNRVSARKAPHLPDGQLLREGQDAELERRVQKALKSADEQSARTLEVEAADGVVCVRGEVADSERHALAVATARAVPGVAIVLDLVRVGR